MNAILTLSAPHIPESYIKIKPFEAPKEKREKKNLSCILIGWMELLHLRELLIKKY